MVRGKYIILTPRNFEYFKTKKNKKNVLWKNFFCISFLVPCITKEEVKIGNIMNFKANKKTNKPKEMARTKRIYWILKY